MSDETWVVTLPKLGESVTEGVIGTFFKNVGDEVEFDDPLFEVSTDKVDTEVPSSYDGVVLEVMAQEGDTVSVGAAIMRIGGKGATVPNRLPSAAHGVAAAGGPSLNDPSAPSVVTPPFIGTLRPAGFSGHSAVHRAYVDMAGDEMPALPKPAPKPVMPAHLRAIRPEDVAAR
jgi:2-oxoglutarate dehydrogenase E2 component (dihydrolipoamide succinyltransferase)